jgi:hypothetical protein
MTENGGFSRPALLNRVKSHGSCQAVIGERWRSSRRWKKRTKSMWLIPVKRRVSSTRRASDSPLWVGRVQPKPCDDNLLIQLGLIARLRRKRPEGLFNLKKLSTVFANSGRRPSGLRGTPKTWRGRSVDSTKVVAQAPETRPLDLFGFVARPKAWRGRSVDSIRVVSELPEKGRADSGRCFEAVFSCRIVPNSAIFCQKPADK